MSAKHAAALAASLALAQAATADVALHSPNRRLQLDVGVGTDGHLRFAVALRGRPVVEPSPLGIRIDGADLGKGVRLGKVEHGSIDERYPWRGVHSQARAHAQTARVLVAHPDGRDAFQLELQAFDDAAAFRFVVPGSGRRVPDAATQFRLPPGSMVWYHGARDHYEGLYTRKPLAEVAAEDWAAPPLTYRLPNGSGYASITEAALRDYAGMMLQADGHGAFSERLGHAVPASYPFLLRYGEEEAKRLSLPAVLEGTITTPWRVVLAGPDLDTLVNSDAIPSLCPPPDPALFPQGLHTPWLRPGRAVWRYLDGGEEGFDGIRGFSAFAGQLGFEHQVVEGLWRRWSDEQLRQLVEESKERGVAVWLWVHSKDQHDPEARRRLFARLHQLGVAGLKVDFFDHEAKETIDLYQAILRDAAEQELMIDFHGANKPTGEPRTFPNEMTREGVRGLEHRSTPAWAEHDTTLPFTRFLAGHGDFTPLVFGERRKETSWAHQIATLVAFSSPLMVYGAHPRSILDNPAGELIRSLPSTWDETRVLSPSAIGELAAFARRSADRWFLGILNGPEARTLRLPLSFLAKGRYHASLVRDRAEAADALALETRDVQRGDVLDLTLRAGGGFVARFSR